MPWRERQFFCRLGRRTGDSFYSSSFYSPTVKGTLSANLGEEKSTETQWMDFARGGVHNYQLLEKNGVLLSKGTVIEDPVLLLTPCVLLLRPPYTAAHHAYPRSRGLRYKDE